MSYRGDDRSYKVAYTRRDRDAEIIDNRIPRHRSRRDYDYDYDYPMDTTSSQDYRDDRVEIDRRVYSSDPRGYPPPAPLPPSGGTMKTTYQVGRDRNSEAYVKRSNALVIDRPKDHARYEYEVLRPEKRDDGTYVIDLDGSRSRDYIEYDTAGRRYYDQPTESRRRDDAVVRYESYRGGGRDRGSHSIYRDVEIVEDTIDDDPRYSRRGRSPDARIDDVAPPTRLRSSMRGRNNSPPELMERRRSRSVGFYRDQISHHDASEGRHERPGAEAHLAGRYLVGNTQYDEAYVDEYGRRSRSRSRGRYGPQRSDPRLGDYDMDDERQTHTEETLRRYEHEDSQRPAYPPQRGQSRRRHHRHRRDDDDDRSSYSEYETRVKKMKGYY